MVDRHRIKTLRIENDWSQQELGDRVGATKQTIGRIENGFRTPSVDLLKRIADVLGTTMDDLYRETA